VSGVAAELLSDELPDGVDLRELGTHQLKDLSRPERIYQVEAPFLAERLGVPATTQPGQPAGQPAGERAGQQASDADRDRAAEVPDLARIECGSGSAKREEAWVVPRRLEIEVGSGSVRLDFRQAVIALPELRIDAQIASGSLKLITRPGIVVDADDLIVSSGSVKVVPSGGSDAPVELRVKVSGRVGSGSVSARPGRRRGWWTALWRRVLRRLAGDSQPALPAAPR
jgi:hypothetical protein